MRPLVARALVGQGRTAEAGPLVERATPPLLETTNAPAYCSECLTAAADDLAAGGNRAEAARLRAALDNSAVLRFSQ